jgi:hypothetical protein
VFLAGESGSYGSECQRFQALSTLPKALYGLPAFEVLLA